MRGDRYQIALIALGVIASAGVGVFFYREMFPEYKIYQNDYVALEQFRSSYTGEQPPVFKEGIKQIVIEREDKGPAVIDRCTSCHVTLQFPHFSPTKIARDINGNILYDAKGVPVQEPNEQYIWGHLDQRITDLTDEKVNEQLIKEGESGKVDHRLKEADSLKALKTARVGKHTYDVTKVLLMHPLMGRETRPFEYHPLETYGCTSCHNGNGRGLTTEKAHGPVFDGEYEQEFVGYVPKFLESDTENDPTFSKIFNGKPGHELLFQTSPIYVGALIQAKCMQCHVTTTSSLENAAFSTVALIQQQQSRTKTIQKALHDEKEALLDTLTLLQSIQANGLEATSKMLQQKLEDVSLPAIDLENASNQQAFIQKIKKQAGDSQASTQAIKELRANAIAALGNSNLVEELEKALTSSSDQSAALNAFITKHAKDKAAAGSIFAKIAALELTDALARHMQDVETSFSTAASDQTTISAITSEIDLLTYNYHRGQELFIAQACYACHRIAGFSRGGVGPELTQEGKAYPWYVKQKITWPQSDLKTSTMPNMKIDHEELEDVVTFVLAQTGENKSISSTAYRSAIQQWEAGRKASWEKPITPAQMLDLNYSMTVFATEGCAACHRLKGFESNVGYTVEKQGTTDFDALYKEKEWFQSLFPEEITGSQIVATIETKAAELNQHIAPDVRKESILENIEASHPKLIESYYAPFKYAMRAKNKAFENDPEKLAAWKQQVHNVLMLYIQEYGLGRLIGPRPNWSGVYRTDEWLMEHFHNPAGHIPRSIMPVLPFDDTKFYALTHLLDVLGMKNRNNVRSIWEHRGFSPELAYELHCAQCHGDYKQGNGPVAEWIYPIPKNLGDGTFLRNLTKENAVISITHGVLGTPMPPWGEAAKKPQADGIPVLTKDEIHKLVDWLYSFLPGENNSKLNEDIPKWRYTPEDAIKELHREGSQLHPKQESSHTFHSADLAPELAALPTGHQYMASLKPVALAANVSTVDEYFDVIPNPVKGGEKDLYYIKKKYYTPENIAQGEAFFEMNCAACHGKEADGAGLRAEAMHDAKPRMLTNLDWIHSRDDLRLLRSIKYGVQGTAMTPWGDFTSSLQRMQLVIFIRSLSGESEPMRALAEAIYQAFDAADYRLEQARFVYYTQLAEAEKKLRSAQADRKQLYAEAKSQESVSKEAIDAYAEELKLQSNMSRFQTTDQLYAQMKTGLKKERDVYENIGKALIQNDNQGKLLSQFLPALELLDGTLTVVDGKLSYRFDNEQKMAAIGQTIENEIQARIDRLNLQKTAVEGRIASTERSRELTAIYGQILSLTKAKNTLVAGFAEGVRIRQQQASLYNDLQKSFDKK